MSGKRIYYYEDDNIKTKASSARYKFSLPFIKDKVVLDIGCGARRGPWLLAREAFGVFGTDISFEAVSYCAKKWPGNNLFYLASDCSILPFKDSYFDIVCAFEVIEHVVDFNACLKEAARVLKKGGVFIASTPNLKVNFSGGMFSNPDHIREFTLQEYRQALEGHFQCPVIYGQFPSQAVRDIEEYERNNLQKIYKAPIFFKRVLPSAIKDFLIKSYQYFSLKSVKHLSKNKISEEDFVFKDSGLEEARNFLAVCRK